MKLLYPFLLLLFLLLSITAGAQQKFSFGLKAAPSVEKKVWLGDDWIDFKPKASFNYGLLGKFYFNEKYFIQTGISLHDKGTRYYVRFISHIPNTEYYLDTLDHTRIVRHIWYLSAPTTINYVLFSSERTKVHLSAGITYGRKVFEFYTIKFKDDLYEKEYRPDTYSSTRKHYWGATMGIGIDYEISPRLSLEVRPNYVRQLTRGWDVSTAMDNQGRYDSYVLDIILWWNP